MDLEAVAKSCQQGYTQTVRDQFDFVDDFINGYLDRLEHDTYAEVAMSDLLQDAWNDIKAAAGYEGKK